MPKRRIEKEDQILVEYVCDKCGVGTMEKGAEFEVVIGDVANVLNYPHKCTNVKCQEVDTFTKLYPYPETT